jgi:hypothetical protein
MHRAALQAALADPAGADARATRNIAAFI